MRLTKEQVENLPDGTEVRIFYSGSKWDEEFGKTFKGIKIKHKLYHIGDFDEIDEINDDEGYEIDVAIPYEN